MKNLKKFLRIYIEKCGISFLNTLLRYLISIENYRLILDIPIYVPVTVNKLNNNKYEFLAMFVLLRIIENRLNKTYPVQIYFLLNVNDCDIFDENKNNVHLIKCIIINDHIIVIDMKKKKVYDVNSKYSVLYSKNASCVFNCTCFILDQLEIPFTVSYLMVFFKLILMDAFYLDATVNIYTSPTFN